MQEVKNQVINWLNQFRQSTVRTTAKDRMRSMLTHDRLELPAGRLECLEEELMCVVNRYFELDKTTTKFDLEQEPDRRASLIANFPLLRSKC